jgi:arylsulfatase A-like enzyme
MRLFRLLPLLAATLGLVPATSAAPAPAPNIIFILADDLGWGELGCYGQRLIQTPRLDRFAAEGVRFSQFYAGSTVCAPSRSVLMTGQHLGRTRVRGNAGGRNPLAQSLQASDVTVARVLRESGYATGLVGKWGLGEVDLPGEPRRQGFDSYFGYLNQTHAHNHYPSFLWRDGVKVPLANDLVPVGDVDGAGYSKNRVAPGSMPTP